jgi:hypothetical protein
MEKYFHFCALCGDLLKIFWLRLRNFVVGQVR